MLLNDDRNRGDWSITAPTLNVTKLGGFFAAVVTPVGGALAAVLKSTSGASDSLVIAILAVVAVVILSATVIAATDIRVRGTQASGLPLARGSEIVALNHGLEVTDAGHPDRRCHALALRERGEGLEYLLVSGTEAPVWCSGDRLTVVGSASPKVPQSANGDHRPDHARWPFRQVAGPHRPS
jgi:hypothetical protein